MHQPILTDLSDAALVVATKANLCEFFRYLGRSPRTEFWESPLLTRWHTPMGHPWFDGVVSHGPAPANASELIEATLAYFQSRDVSILSWWLDPRQPSAGWDAPLRALGFGYEGDTPGMAIALDAVRHDIPLPTGLEISVVENLEDLQVFIRAAVAGYAMPDTSARDFFELIAGLGLDLPIRHYVGRLAGQPVATSSFFLAAGVAGVQFVSTRPEARGRGVAAAMARAPLREAQALGYQAGILQSSEMGYRVYERLGFRRVSEVGNYFWKR